MLDNLVSLKKSEMFRGGGSKCFRFFTVGRAASLLGVFCERDKQFLNIDSVFLDAGRVIKPTWGLWIA
jgi:hypothetical protein